MPPGPDQSRGDALLRGLFGGFQQAAQQGADTAQTWALARINAATWQFQAQGGGELPSTAELEARGREILSRAGIDAIAFGQMRGVANQWLTARRQLQADDPNGQIMAGSIFRPPWAQTAGGAEPDRYRVRVQWQITPTIGDAFTKWHSYELTSPITSVAGALGQAQAKIAGDRYLQLLSGDQAPTIVDYTIEQI